ncbi:hypothetical protein PC129_g16337 [Phytophthora cactorum]|uniref:Uncharacterized protein n=1 Tax=Phytophthora cactorum TaxID=29920 RepID=A0A329RQE6_9STRA|nr:hypothetical protein PC111_g12953 [Phytophthora cactorum]KAG2893852.1 hypothetical protein PC114_g16121 [Phytophthora cactorum]KAG2929791.1 hypothetical protein PC117_g13919 [Phytophthora cactorum]KAG3006512.1 hypothetical protein PC119_g14935 [Phytophthora cactorum]KAG3013704.1 hypothetical protein PC120_g13138 [Phytophthora cactorum]
MEADGKTPTASKHADIETGVDDTEIAENFNNKDSEALLSSSKKKLDGPRFSYKRACLQTGIGFGGLVIMSIIVVTVSCVCSPLVAYSAMNVTLNELFFSRFGAHSHEGRLKCFLGRNIYPQYH